MPVIERTSERLVLKAGSTTLTLDKVADRVTLERKLLLWSRKPIAAPLSDVTAVTIDAAVDRSSGVEVCHTMLIMHGAEGWAFPAADRKDAEATAATLRDFLAITR